MRYIIASLAFNVLLFGTILASDQISGAVFTTAPVTLVDVTSKGDLEREVVESPFIEYNENTIRYTELPDMSEVVEEEEVPVAIPQDFSYYIQEETVVCSTLESAQAVANAVREASTNPLRGPDAYIVFWDNKECTSYSDVTINLYKTVDAQLTDKNEYVAIVPLSASTDEISSEEAEQSYAVIIPLDVWENVFRCVRSDEDMEAGIDGLEQCRAPL
jgi:hypothetical protein